MEGILQMPLKGGICKIPVSDKYFTSSILNYHQVWMYIYYTVAHSYMLHVLNQACKLHILSIYSLR